MSSPKTRNVNAEVERHFEDDVSLKHLCRVADSRRKPIMYIVTSKDLCPACSRLRDSMNGVTLVSKLFDKFVMARAFDTYAHPFQDNVAETYYPRIYFMYSNCSESAIHGPIGDWVHFYSEDEDVISSMNEVLRLDPKSGH